jgi:hypothetical protein
MKYFIKRLFTFALFLIGLLGTNLLIISINYHNKPYILEKDVDTVILGNSLTMYSINPKIIKHSVNLAQAAEPYENNYFKLKYLLENNHGIKNIFLSYSPINFSPVINKMNRNSLLIPFGFYYFVPIDTLESDFNSTLGDYMRNYLSLNLFNSDILRAILTGKEYYPFVINTYIPENSLINSKNILHQLLNVLYYNPETKKLNNMSYISLKYLFLIIDLCKKNNITLFLIDPPKNSEYNKRIPFKFKIFFQKMNKYLIKNKKIVILNYSQEKIPEQYYYDHVHLNRKGIDHFSQQLKKYLETNPPK